MSCINITACQLASSPSAFPAQSFRLSKASTCPSIYLGTNFPKVFLKLTSATSRYQRGSVVCQFGGKGKSENGNEGSPWKALENAMGNFKKNLSVEDVLKQQIEKKDYYDDGGPGGKPPGGGDGGGDGFGEAEDPGMWDESLQVFMATFALIFVYIYIMRGQEVIALAKDLFKFLVTRKKSLRLERLISQCQSFLESMKVKEEFVDPYWLEKEIISTTTWYDSPDKYMEILKSPDSISREDDDNILKRPDFRSREDHDYDDNDNILKRPDFRSREDDDNDDDDNILKRPDFRSREDDDNDDDDNILMRPDSRSREDDDNDDDDNILKRPDSRSREDDDNDDDNEDDFE